ncbi:2-oxoglutarate and iron-dependent oxygenase domain-containing protein 3-like [Acanthaster planci]|uniref:2-oxoglutarate and iron-dependent oxygenase domain-containing protein 3-like n=1 Tax=Acanthaster planci TaxID=133434 RepID=A0A8B7XVS3_ACAPL|nr:2-oxoglutarate and iron-dependent oxygenase domain-containing protein 3-like [Acanthaster planci]
MAPRRRKPVSSETNEAGDSKKKHNHADKEAESSEEEVPRHRVTFRSLALRLLAIFFFLGLAHWYSAKAGPQTLAQQTETVHSRRFNVTCSSDFASDLKRFKGCAPTQCGRVIMDSLVSKSEARHLLELAKNGLQLGGSNGGASILDLHSGALSKGDSFINIYKYLEKSELGSVFHEGDFQLYSTVAKKIKLAIAKEFRIQPSKLYLTHPTFFSRMTNKPAKTIHDEYWHVHVDKETYDTFDYTSLLYLADYGKDFEGGRFIFTDKGTNMTVEPKLGRLSFFTSGSENTHFVERVTKGTRYAITVSFTCDKAKAIEHPKLRKS